jgi:hypothetical protein
MHVAVYARVSTSQHEKNDTIESQLETLQAYVASPEYSLFPDQIFLDNGISGSRLDRPALDRLRDQARMGAFDAVVRLAPERLARSYPHQWLLREELKKPGGAVMFWTNPCGDSPHGIPTRTGQNQVCHAASVRSLRTNSISTGRGYDNKTQTGVPRTETRRKFSARKDNYARAKRPHEEWVPSTAPAIVRVQTCAKAQEQLQRNQAQARRAYQPTSQRYLLRTLVRCGPCQWPMQATQQRSVCKRYTYRYYQCAGQDPVTAGRVPRCPARLVRADRRDARVWTLVRELLPHPQAILQEYALWQQVQQGQQGQFQDQLERVATQRHN